jgi:hypothetical protein
MGVIFVRIQKTKRMIITTIPFAKKFSFTNIIKQNRVFITPFTEMPASNTFGNQEQALQEPEQFNAVSLFSIFTADIIRQDVVFTR